MNWFVGMQGILERVLPVSSGAGQAHGDETVGRPRALSTGTGEGSSEPPLCLQRGEQGGRERSRQSS